MCVCVCVCVCVCFMEACFDCVLVLCVVMGYVLQFEEIAHDLKEYAIISINIIIILTLTSLSSCKLKHQENSAFLLCLSLSSLIINSKNQLGTLCLLLIRVQQSVSNPRSTGPYPHCHNHHLRKASWVHLTLYQYHPLTK